MSYRTCSFGHLGFELRDFIMSRSTSSNALKALWMFFCRHFSTNRETPYKPNFKATALRALVRLNQVRNIVVASPDMTNHITELTLATPVTRFTTLGGHCALVPQLPVVWKGNLFHNNLLRRLTRLIEAASDGALGTSWEWCESLYYPA